MNDQPISANHISVCICTYKRPQMLSNLISKLQDQITEKLFNYSVIVVDNEANQSAREIVKYWQDKSIITIDYHCMPEQNIALARNMAVENAKGNFIAFIDDDEFPVSSWLLNLYKTLCDYHADGTLGPVRPHYPENTPTWLIKSKLCERREFKTGTILHWGQTRTGNTLLSKRLFEDKNFWFDPAYGRTGGEDTMFFKKHHENRKLFIWCNEAPAYETVPTERWSKNFHIRKSLRIGCVVGEALRKHENEFNDTSKQKLLLQQIYLLTKSSVWIISMAVLLPLSILCGQHYYMRCRTKLNYNFGVISGFLGYVIIRYRN
jgi:succinoglycan biosynthesis protein ExoM